MQPEPTDDVRPPLASLGSPAAHHRELETAVALYSAVTTRGSSTVTEANRYADLDDTHAADGWRILHDLGLVRIVLGRVEAVHPDAALTVVMDEYMRNAAAQSQNARALNERAQALLTVFRPAVGRLQERVVVETYADRDSRDSALLDLHTAVRHTADSLHPGPMPSDMAVLERSLEMDAVMVQRGVRTRAVYPRSLLESPKYTKYLHDLCDVGVQVRLVDHAPHDLLIFDTHTVFLPGDPEDRSKTMIIVRGSVLVKSYVAIFKDLWLHGTSPLKARSTRTAGAEQGDQERAIVKLLSNGYSDERIARRLGIARRTVQRAVTKLMERMDVSSRFELGFRLAQETDPADL